MTPLPPPSMLIDPVSDGPLELFQRLKGKPFPFWLDSAGGPTETARWSFLGADPFAWVETREGATRLWREGGAQTFSEDPLTAVRSLLSEFERPPDASLPPFIGGAVGWLSYDLARQWERLPALSMDDTRLPEMCLAFYPTIYAYDHWHEQGWRVAHPAFKGQGEPESYSDHKAQAPKPPSSPLPCSGLPAETLIPTDYRRAVLRIKSYIAAGDIYQANLTQRFAQRLLGTPPDLYFKLRRVNPAPFAAYLGFGETAVMSASPERFLSLDASTRWVETRPIKGTRPRSPDPDEDAALARALRESEKDRAENLMIVDVHRNDLGRVCEIGSVKVPTLWGLESYATVHHLVSVVEGRLPHRHSPLDLIRAAFPAGSISGAPKLRAMEIIEELEPVRRGIYTGAIGYIGWDGGMDLSVAIRTLIAQNGWVHYGVGGGIVADSDPEAEYEETLVKARGLKMALGM